MLDLLLRLLAEAGPAAVWIAGFAAAVIAAFVVLIGIAMRATLRAAGPDERQLRYQIFRDLLELFQIRIRK